MGNYTITDSGFDVHCPCCSGRIADIRPLPPDFTDRYRLHDVDTSVCPHCNELFGVRACEHTLIDEPLTIIKYYQTFKL